MTLTDREKSEMPHVVAHVCEVYGFMRSVGDNIAVNPKFIEKIEAMTIKKPIEHLRDTIEEMVPGLAEEDKCLIGVGLLNCKKNWTKEEVDELVGGDGFKMMERGYRKWVDEFKKRTRSLSTEETLNLTMASINCALHFGVLEKRDGNRYLSRPMIEALADMREYKTPDKHLIEKIDQHCEGKANPREVQIMAVAVCGCMPKELAEKLAERMSTGLAVEEVHKLLEDWA